MKLHFVPALRVPIVTALLALTTAAAQPPQAAAALLPAPLVYELHAPRLRVLVADPALLPFAQRTLREAERALELLEPLLGEAPPLTLLLQDQGDVFNAAALSVPRATTLLSPLFPSEVALGYAAEDALFLLLLHELTHNLHLSYTEGASPLGLGLVGEGVAALPPLWFTEGLAVWTESAFTAGGRQGDALTRGLRASQALADTWPSLASAGLATHADWPGGLTRYLYGAGFVDRLVERYGWEGLMAALRAYNAAGLQATFADAWRSALGADLAAEWAAWQRDERRAAVARAESAWEGARRSFSAGHTRAPAVSPSGERLAWVRWPEGVVVAPLDALSEARLVRAERLPTALVWLDEDTLLYARTVRQLGVMAGAPASDLFTLELASGRETRLTWGARARFPSLREDGCVLFWRDAPGEGALEALCQEGERWLRQVIWRPPPGMQVLGVAAGVGDRVALSLWRGGGANLALLEGETLRALTHGAFQDLEPRWDGETLLFRSDRDPEGAFDLYALAPGEGALRRLTRSVGGAFTPTPTPAGLVYLALGAEGYDLALLTEPLGEPWGFLPADAARPAPAVAPSYPGYRVTRYSPWSSLAPFGWLPVALGFGDGADGALRPALGVAVLGQDASLLHQYALTLGYDGALGGVASGFYANLRYAYGEPGLGSPLGAPAGLALALQAGGWPHRPHLEPARETALGLRGEARTRLPLGDWTATLELGAGLLALPSRPGLQPDLRAAAALAFERRDAWGYPSRGTRAALEGVLSAGARGPSAGIWAEARHVRPLAPGRLVAAARLGYRPPPPLPAAARGDWVGFASLGYALTLPLAWRYGDGRYAAERLTLEPRLHLVADVPAALPPGSGVGLSPRLAAELSVQADLVFNYAAPASLGVSVGYGPDAGGLWTRVRYRLPF